MRIQKMFNKKIMTFLLFIIVVVNTVFIAGCIKDNDDKEKATDSDIVIGMVGDISGFYPWMGSRDITTLAVNVNLFNCLVELDPFTYDLIPGLVKNWNNPNSTTWRFFLREGVQFHNGNFFNGEDVKFTIEYMRNAVPFHTEELEPISDIVIIDNYTIDIITKKPCPTLLYKFATLNILSEEYMKSIEGTNETWPIGTGPYQLVDYSPGNSFTFERFDKYWGDQPEVKSVTFKKMKNSTELRNALLNREIDICSLAIEDVPKVQNTTGFIVKSIQTPNVVYLGFDFRVNDSYGFKGYKNPVSDIRVRKAMYYAIDIDTIIKKCYKGAATPASQFVTYFIFGYNPSIERLPYDVGRAKELMQEAGYEAGFTITLDTSNTARSVNISNEIARQLSTINITVILTPLPSSEYYSKLYLKNTSFYIAGISPLEAEGIIKLLLQTSDIMEGKGIWNYGNYSNAAVDRLCEELFYTMDSSMRRDLIQEIFSIAISDVAWVPLYSPKSFYGMTNKIDWTPCPSTYFWVKDISFNK